MEGVNAMLPPYEPSPRLTPFTTIEFEQLQEERHKKMGFQPHRFYQRQRSSGDVKQKLP
jgi:hypothetical protein